MDHVDDLKEPPPEAHERGRVIHQVLQTHWGFKALRPLQRQAIDAALDQRDALVVLPTGGGKSLCYQVPPLVTGSLTIVVSPLIALMQDQVDGLRLAGVKAAAMHSNATAAEINELRHLAATGSLRLLFVAPERLFTPGFLPWLSDHRIGAFAIDEAHCISQWGHDFRPEYRRIAELRKHFPGIPFHAFTATATPQVRADIVAQLRLHDPVELVGVFDRANLTYRVLPRIDRTAQIIEAIQRHPAAAAIVYCLSRKDTETIASELNRRGIRAKAYHAGLEGPVRTTISEDFRAERLPVVVATVAFGMGIDRSDVRLVVHAALPKSLEHYQQETGRAGRDGLPAECLLLYSSADAAKWRSIIERNAEETGLDQDFVSGQLTLLRGMQRLANQVCCRHRTISAYFGQDYEPTNCGACDVCLNELEPVPDAHETAQKILSAVARTGQRFGSKHVVDVLRGRRTERVLQLGHDQIKTFGLLASVPAAALSNYVDQLVDAGLLQRSDGDYPVLALTHDAVPVLKGERQATLMKPRLDLASRAEEARQKRPRRGSPEVVDMLDPPERKLFEALRGLRRQLAAELSVPPYLVFSDVTLTEMARHRPSTAAGLAQVRGVGPKKLAGFGERFLLLVAEQSRVHGLALDTTDVSFAGEADAG